MGIVKLQGEKEKQSGIYYEFDTSSKSIGEGGMGKVFRGKLVNTQTRQSRDVAIKFMFSGLPQNVIQRAENEANIQIKHENLVEMMGFLAVETRQPDGTTSVRYHVVSELLWGVSLSDLLQGIVTDQNGNVIPYAQNLYKMYNTDPEKFAVTMIINILSGIMALHDAGYIHRDIDPSNIMITTDRKIKLIDFGIAKQVSGLKTHDRNLTTAGQFMGKPQYAAPELIIGDLKSQNKPTDIYAIGVLLYQLILGHLPFEGPANVVIHNHLHDNIPLKPIKNKILRKIIRRATEKDCSKRYQSAAVFRADLDNFLLGLDAPSFIDRPNEKMPIIVGTSVGILLIVLCVVIYMLLKPGDPPPKPVEMTLNAVKEQLHNPSEANAGLDNLKKMSDKGDIEAKYVLSRIYAVSSGSFTLADEILIMQANLSKEVTPNAATAHNMLKDIVSKKPDHYQALYDLACNYYEGTSLTGGEERSLRRAKELLDEAYKHASNAEDPIYVNKISALLRKY